MSLDMSCLANITSIDQVCMPIPVRTKIEIAIARSSNLYMTGPPGVGKTLIVKLLAKEYNRSLIDINASLLTSVRELKIRIGGAQTGAGLDGKEALIFFDECEALKQSSGAHTRSMNAFLKELLRTSEVSIVFASNIDKDVLPIIKKGCKTKVILQPPTEKQITTWALHQLDKDKNRLYAYTKEQLDEMNAKIPLFAKRCKGDMRYFAECITTGIDYAEVRAEEDPTIYDVIRWIFNMSDRTALAKRLIDVFDKEPKIKELNPYNILHWIEENSLHLMRNSPFIETNLTILNRSAELMGDTDVFANMLAALVPTRPVNRLKFPQMYSVEMMLRKKKKAKSVQSVKKGKTRGRSKKKETTSIVDGGLSKWLSQPQTKSQ